MRYRKGSKVEILSEKDLPSGSWRCGEIVCGDGHSYTVRYVGNGDNSDEVVMERVSMKAIRPRPPLRKVPANWVPGDVVGVRHGFSWRMATISKVLRIGYYLVRLLGSNVEFEASKSEIRTRQSWEDNKWAVIEKNSGNCDQTTRMQTDVHVKGNLHWVNESNIVSRRTSKRMGGSNMEAETLYGPTKRLRTTYKKGIRYPDIAAQVSPLTEQVDGVTLGRERLVEEYLHSSFDIINRYCEVEAERRSDGAVGCSSAMNLEPDTARSVTCSVGSCSISGDNSRQWYYHGRSAREVDDYCSDAESFCGRDNKEAGRASFITKEVLAAEIHKLELHAYHCTIVALHASGPLSWDQEAMMTNLRLSLHISNDEHLMEYIVILRITGGVAGSIRGDVTVVHFPGQGLEFLPPNGWPVSGAPSSADR